MEEIGELGLRPQVSPPRGEGMHSTPELASPQVAGARALGGGRQPEVPILPPPVEAATTTNAMIPVRTPRAARFEQDSCSNRQVRTEILFEPDGSSRIPVRTRRFERGSNSNRVRTAKFERKVEFERGAVSGACCSN